MFLIAVEVCWSIYCIAFSYGVEYFHYYLSRFFKQFFSKIALVIIENGAR